MGSLKKAEYIEKYGEEAWDAESRRRAVIYNRYNKSHQEARKTYRENHLDQHAAAQKRYRERHKDELQEINKKQCRKYYYSQSGRAIQLIHKYYQSDLEENRGECSVTKQWILDNIFNSKCLYCGDSNWKHLGCDRIDDSLPHTEDNCVCACGICNVERYMKKMSISEFAEYRKTHPRDEEPKKLQEIVEINGKKVIKKVG